MSPRKRTNIQVKLKGFQVYDDFNILFKSQAGMFLAEQQIFSFFQCNRKRTNS